MADVYLVTGDRWWGTPVGKRLGEAERQVQVMQEVLDQIPKGRILIHGAAAGADQLAGNLWRMTVHGPIVVVPYFGWLGRGGGPARNNFMLNMLCLYRNDGAEVEVLAFHPDLTKSAGTKHCVNAAKRLRLLVEVFS